MSVRLSRWGRDVLKTAMASAFADTGIIDLLCRVRLATRGPRVHVFGYHRVVDHVDVSGLARPTNPALCISERGFRRQMEQVRKRFQVLTFEDAVRAIDGQLRLERDACTVTFDDGYHDVIARAHPILRELGIPATVFVPSGLAESGAFLPHDRLYAVFWQARGERRRLSHAKLPPRVQPWVRHAERTAHAEGPAAAVEFLITGLPAAELDLIADALEAHLGGPLSLDRGARVLEPDEIHALASEGWEIGAHTVNHVVLTHEPLARVKDELERPRAALAEWSGRTCRYFAYCSGLHSPAIVAAARRAGYVGAVTTFDRWNARGGDSMRIGRKVLWEAHTRGPDGTWNPAVSAAHLHDLFGSLGLTRPLDGEVAGHNPEVPSCGV